MRAYKATMHFFKPGKNKGLPWTVHYRGACHHVAKIVCETVMESEWKPDKKDNPRAFFTTKAKTLEIVDDVAFLR